MEGAGRRGIGPVGGGDRVGVGVGAAGEHLADQALAVDRLHERLTHMRVAEEGLAIAVRVEADERVGEQPRLLDRQVGPTLQRVDLLRLDPTHEVGGAGQHSADRQLGIGGWIRSQDEVVEVRLRSRVWIAVEGDGELVDRAHFERAGAECT